LFNKTEALRRAQTEKGETPPDEKTEVGSNSSGAHQQKFSQSDYHDLAEKLETMIIKTNEISEEHKEDSEEEGEGDDFDKEMQKVLKGLEEEGVATDDLKNLMNELS